MKNGYISRRRLRNEAWARNRNTVRHEVKDFSSIVSVGIFLMLVLIAGLIITGQGTNATGHDYELSKIEKEISDLQMKKEDLVLERARLTSAAEAEKTRVAMAMEEAKASGFVGE